MRGRVVRGVGRAAAVLGLAACALGPGAPSATAAVSTATEPVGQPATAATGTLSGAVLQQIEHQLSSLGYPTGTLDGTVTAYTRQALCAWRYTHGLPGGRSGPTADVVTSILAGQAAPTVARADGIYVDKTCQVLFQVVNHKYKRVVRVSTAGTGFNTPNGTGHVWKKIAGWHESSLYPGAYMYDALYFRTDRPAIALHGSVTNSLVKTYPASHGCVRVLRPTIAKIFAETPIGTPVQVFGKY